MCGICGFTGPPDPDRLSAMMAVLRHRGPDGEGRWEGERASLGHRRLAIIDVAGGRQPMANETGDVYLVANGEIYNHAVLREELTGQGHRFQTTCDSEVILHLYEEHGPECVHRLDGMFAFAIQDGRRGRLFLARDRLGIKPLYVTEQAEPFAFASEAKALLPFLGGKPRLDREALARYLIYRYVPAPWCLFQGMRKLPPGHYAQVEGGRYEETCYWSVVEQARNPAPGTDPLEMLGVLLRQSVGERLMSEVPLGAYLSGGLDSSVIVALMSGMSERPVETFSVGFRDGGRYDESAHARAVAGHFHTNHHELQADTRDVELLRSVVWHLDEPMGDAATLPTFRMAELTKPLATVVLTGEGADELFAGYGKYSWMLALERARARWPIPGLMERLAFRYDVRRLARQLGHASGEFWRRYVDFVAVFGDQDHDRRLLFGNNAGAVPGVFDAESERLRDQLAKAPAGDGLNRLLLADLVTWLPDDLLAKVDRTTMAHGVEARVPYLDHQLVEYVVSLPSDLKYRKGQNKRLLRSLAADLLPEEVRRRKKQGFTVPLGQWLDEGLREFAQEVMGEARLRRQGLFNPRFLPELLRRRPDNPYHRRMFWTMLFLQVWMDVYEVEV